MGRLKNETDSFQVRLYKRQIKEIEEMAYESDDWFIDEEILDTLNELEYRTYEAEMREDDKEGYFNGQAY